LQKAIEPQLPDRLFLRLKYRRRWGESLDLNNPQGFTEKLNWLKLNDRSRLHPICADKLAVRDYVANTLGSSWLTPLLLVGDSEKIVNEQTITEDAFVIKTTHDWNSSVFCTDRARFNWSLARRQIRESLNHNHYLLHREWAYRRIRPRVLVERHIGVPGNTLRDYKVYCFHAVPKLVLHVEQRKGERVMSMFGADWQPYAVGRRGWPYANEAVPRPPFLAELKAAAAALSAPFAFCRVDFIATAGRLRFGEITFYPEGGMRPFEPRAFELELGAWLDLSAVAHGGRR